MKTARFLAVHCVASMCLMAHAVLAEEGYSYEAHASLAQDYAVGGAGQIGVPEQSAWHAGYYHTMWGRPVALVAPPTVTHQTNWGWGIGNTRVAPLYPQFLGPMNSALTASPYGPYRPTPYYVSDTLQFGVYSIRGPW
jgi:hypothetical protein